MNMIERMARAIMDSQYLGAETTCADRARFILRAMHEPTSAMLDAGSSCPQLPNDIPGEFRSGSLTVWRAMIDAALEEK